MGCCVHKDRDGRVILDDDSGTYLTLPSSYYCENTPTTNVHRYLYILSNTPTIFYSSKSPINFYSKSA
jgi:hypothetical protein